MRIKVGVSVRSVSRVAVCVCLLSIWASRAADAQVTVLGSDINAAAPDANQGGAASISIVGARNGTFSGRVGLSSTSPIGGLKATVGDLKQGAATISASQIGIRYEVPWDDSFQGTSRPLGLDILQESPQADYPAGAVPVWVTVKVPKDAKPGSYSGQLSLEARNLPPTNVPVKLEVRDWTLPDPQDYRTWVEMIEQPDTLALEYNLPLWSDKHWEMVAKSLRLLADTGSRVINIPLIACTNYGNAESMVRWIKKGPNQYEYDFSIVDKYLDVVEKNLGKPKITQVYAWEVYLAQPKQDKPVEVKGEEGKYDWQEATFVNSRLALKDKGPFVTVLDPATGKTENVNLPRYEDPASAALWQPVWTELRKRLAKRGWDKTMMIGNLTDYQPTKEELRVLGTLSGGLSWTCCAHHLNTRVEGKTLGQAQGMADIGYAAVALDQYYNFNPAKAGHQYAWKLPPLHAQYHRFQLFNSSTLVSIRGEPECLVTGNKRGLGHVGGDYWPCLRGKSGKRTGTATDRFPQSYWHSLNVMSWMLAPQPAGPVGTARLEVFREGIQECEARIAIERGLSDESLKSKLGQDLAKRAQDFLDDRLVCTWKGVGVTDADLQQFGLVTEYRKWYFEIGKRVDAKAGTRWFLASHWQDRDAKLFDLAGEVTKKIEGK